MPTSIHCWWSSLDQFGVDFLSGLGWQEMLANVMENIIIMYGYHLSEYTYWEISESQRKAKQYCISWFYRTGVQGCLKYGLEFYVNDKIISNASWKDLVNSPIMEREHTRRAINVCLFISLRLYGRVLPMIGLSEWWLLAESEPHPRQCC